MISHLSNQEETHGHFTARAQACPHTGGGVSLMGIRSIVEVLDHAPDCLTPAERLVLVVIAENINDDDPQRQTWPNFSAEVLRKRTGMKSDTLQKALRRLGGRGLEARIAIGKGKDGRPLYAVPSKQCRYRLPPLQGGTPVPPSPLEEASASSDGEGRNRFRPNGEGRNLFRAEGNSFRPKGGTDPGQGGTSSGQGGTDSAPSPLSSPSEVPPLSSDGGSAPSAHPSPPVDRDEREEDPRGKGDPPPTPAAPRAADPLSTGDPMSTTERGEEPRTPAAPRTPAPGHSGEREDHQGKTPPPPDVDVLGVPADLARQVMHATGATGAELAAVVEAARRDGIRSPVNWLRSTAGAANFRARLADARTAPAAGSRGSRPWDKPLAEALAAPDGIPRRRDEDTTRRGASAAREALQALRRPTGRGGDPQTFGALIPSVVGGQSAEGTDGG